MARCRQCVIYIRRVVMREDTAVSRHVALRPHSTTSTSSRESSPTSTISWSYSCGKLNGEVARHADILAAILGRMSVSWNVAFTSVCVCVCVCVCEQYETCTPRDISFAETAIYSTDQLYSVTMRPAGCEILPVAWLHVCVSAYLKNYVSVVNFMKCVTWPWVGYSVTRIVGNVMLLLFCEWRHVFTWAHIHCRW